MQRSKAASSSLEHGRNVPENNLTRALRYLISRAVLRSSEGWPRAKRPTKSIGALGSTPRASRVRNARKGDVRGGTGDRRLACGVDRRLQRFAVPPARMRSLQCIIRSRVDPKSISDRSPPSLLQNFGNVQSSPWFKQSDHEEISLNLTITSAGSKTLLQTPSSPRIREDAPGCRDESYVEASSLDHQN